MTTHRIHALAREKPARDTSSDDEGAAFLVGDIGGTNARFALARPGGGGLAPGEVTAFPTARHASLVAAIGAFLDERGNPPLAGLALAAAGPLSGEGAAARIAMTNHPWTVEVRDLATFAEAPVLMNDFAAVAMAVPALGPDDVVTLGGAGGDPSAPAVVLGAGTGLGVAGLVRREGRTLVLPGEGGHADLAAGNASEAELIARLWRDHPHVSAERVLSGPGLVLLHQAIAARDGDAADHVRAPQDVALGDLDGSCSVCKRTIDQFCDWLGAFAGDLALIFGARGGVWIAGGIVPNWVSGRTRGRFDALRFRARFLDKGRFRDWLADVPVHVVTRPDPALLGLARALAERVDGGTAPPR